MDVGVGIFMLTIGAVLAISAKGLERTNAAVSRRFLKESRGPAAANFYVWMFRVDGSCFFVLGVLLATGMVESAEYK